MPKGDDKEIVSAVISKELKKRLKKYADSKRWSMSQAAGRLRKDWSGQKLRIREHSD
jgi:hypothetical protein